MRKDKPNFYYTSFNVEKISFRVISTHKGIKEIYLNKAIDRNKLKRLNATRLYPDDPYMFDIEVQMQEYFDGTRKKFNLFYDLQGTTFQKKVWNELLKIPYGKAISYGQMAKKLGNSKLVRAVGRALSTNPLPIIIPCHRVIASDGTIGGYSAGVNLKIELLELEGYMSLELF
jgi:methylated-DNA-[protein]-cysteine S-methyltransferase